MSSEQFMIEEVAKHNKPDDAWIVIKDVVYDITEYIKIHPGGKQILLDAAGADGTELFNDNHSYVNEEKHLGKKKLGHLKK